MSEIKPCPFCGAEAKALDYKNPFEDTVSGVGCVSCGAEMAWHPDAFPYDTAAEDAARQAETVAAWNKRPDEDEAGVIDHYSIGYREGLKDWAEKVAENGRLNAELEAVSAAIGSCRFMDQPDGGSVTLAEQVERMRQALEAAEAKAAESGRAGIEAAARYVDALWNAHTREFGIYDASTNATEFTGASEDIDCLYQELIEGIRALDDARVDRARTELAKAKAVTP